MSLGKVQCNIVTQNNNAAIARASAFDKEFFDKQMFLTGAAMMKLMKHHGI
jgi:hypothetical protein